MKFITTNLPEASVMLSMSHNLLHTGIVVSVFHTKTDQVKFGF